MNTLKSKPVNAKTAEQKKALLKQLKANIK